MKKYFRPQLVHERLRSHCYWTEPYVLVLSLARLTGQWAKSDIKIFFRNCPLDSYQAIGGPQTQDLTKYHISSLKVLLRYGCRVLESAHPGGKCRSFANFYLKLCPHPPRAPCWVSLYWFQGEFSKVFRVQEGYLGARGIQQRLGNIHCSLIFLLLFCIKQFVS